MRCRLVRPEAKGRGKKISERYLGDRAVAVGIEDPGLGEAELKNSLTAGAARHARSAVEVDDGNGADADVGAIEADSGCDGCLFGAGGQTEAGVFDVGAGDDDRLGLAGGLEQQSRAHAKVAVGRVRVVGGLGGALMEIVDLRETKAAGVRIGHVGEDSRDGRWGQAEGNKVQKVWPVSTIASISFCRLTV